MKGGVVVFPGSNCDRDAGMAFDIYNIPFDYLWHKDSFSEKNYDLIILPGGFSYGDYLRPGAMARFSPAMESVIRYAGYGRPLLGICNGFQILCEAGLLPGTLILNKNMKHIAKNVEIKKINSVSIFTSGIPERNLNLPVSHSDGAFFIDKNDKIQLEDQNRIAFTYCDNINGSVGNIAGILSEKKNILGLMPHPERALDRQGFQSTDGRYIFESILKNLK